MMRKKYFGTGLIYFVLCCISIFLLLSGSVGRSAWAEESLPVPVKDRYSIYYEQVVEVDGNFKQGALFNRTKQWVAQNYVATALYNPIQLEDKENGIIIVRIYFKYSTQFFIHQADYTVHCIGKIQVKDGKYKYTFSDFTYVCSSTNKHYEVKEPRSCDNLIHQHEVRNPSSGSYTKALHGLDKGMKKIIASLHKSLIEPKDF